MMTSRYAAERQIYLIQPKFPPSYWGLEHFLPLTPYRAVFPPLGLLTLAALTPPEFRVTLCDENAGERDRLRHGRPDRRHHRLHHPDGPRLRDRRPLPGARQDGGPRRAAGQPAAGRVPAALRRALRGGGGVHLAALPAGVRRRRRGGSLPRSTKRSTCPIRRRRAWTCSSGRYAHGIVQCTRGCPFTCEFCDIIVMYGRKMRFKPVDAGPGGGRGLARPGRAAGLLRRRQLHRQPRLRQGAAARPGQPGTPRSASRCRSTRRPASTWSATRSCSDCCATPTSSSVFIGIESPRKASLAETHKTQNEKLDLVAAIHKIQSYNLFISAGMIVGFDNDDASIFDEQYAFLQEAQIPIVMLSVLLAVPRTPLYQRLEAAGRHRQRLGRGPLRGHQRRHQLPAAAA